MQRHSQPQAIFVAGCGWRPPCWHRVFLLCCWICVFSFSARKGAVGCCAVGCSAGRCRMLACEIWQHTVPYSEAVVAVRVVQSPASGDAPSDFVELLAGVPERIGGGQGEARHPFQIASGCGSSATGLYPARLAAMVEESQLGVQFGTALQCSSADDVRGRADELECALLRGGSDRSVEDGGHESMEANEHEEGSHEQSCTSSCRGSASGSWRGSIDSPMLRTCHCRPADDGHQGAEGPEHGDADGVRAMTPASW